MAISIPFSYLDHTINKTKILITHLCVASAARDGCNSLNQGIVYIFRKLFQISSDELNKIRKFICDRKEIAFVDIKIKIKSLSVI